MNTHPEEEKYTASNRYEKRAAGDEQVPSPGHSAQHVPSDYRTVNGWGADLHERPMFPRELPSTVMNVRGPAVEKQVPHTKVHQSIEHPDLTPVFGASVPPSGLSGMMRDYAYQFSEATNRHWMTLILADRVDVVEHLIGDIFRGKGDRYLKEKQWSAFYKYAEPAQKRKYIAVGAAAVGAIALGIMLRNAMREND